MLPTNTDAERLRIAAPDCRNNGLRPMPSLADRFRNAIARRFFVALRRATHRMPRRLEVIGNERVLVAAPHLDDEAIPCGGTILLHALAGGQVHVVFTTDSAGQSPLPDARDCLRSVRRAEAAAAKQVLGYQTSELYDFPDGGLVQHEEALRDRLAASIAEFQPTRILCPFPSDAHADHQATSLATALAAVDAGFEGDLWAYEMWTPIWPNVAIDISAVAADKERAIASYATQNYDRDYVGAAMGLARYRGLLHGVAYAEAFYACRASRFWELASQLDRIP